MRIKKITWQIRRDFSAIMECEFCGNTEELTSGYDDSYYHQEVIPDMKCGKCNESTKGGGGKVQPRSTRYPDGMQL